MTPRRAIAWGLGLALGSLALLDCNQHKESDFSPTAPAVREALQILLSALTAPADGVTTVEVVAQISPEADFRKVVFKTTLGVFLDPDSGNNRQRTVDEADIEGRAVAQLKSDSGAERKVGRAAITVEVLGPKRGDENTDEVKVSRTAVVEFVPISPSVVSFQVSAKEIVADGFSRALLEAHVSPDLPIQYRDLTFEATAPGNIVGGSAVTGTTGTSTLNVKVDARGDAEAELVGQVGLVGRGEARVKLTNFPEVFQAESIDYVAAPQGSIRLEASASSIPADGFSTVELTATIGSQTPPTFRDVVFVTTGGTFVGLGTKTNSDKQITVKADPAGIARTQLKSDTNQGVVEVQASLMKDASVFDTEFIDFTAPDPGAIIRISTSASSAPADNATLTSVFADIAPGLEGTANRTVTFGSSLGTFPNGSKSAEVLADAGNRATTQIKSPSDLGTDQLTARVSGTTAQTTLTYVRALPDFISVKPESFVMTGNDLTITVTLARSIGNVTVQTQVDYAIVKQSDGTALDLVFQSITRSNTSQQSTAELVRGSSTFLGFAVVRATVPGSSAVGEAVIDIQ